MSNRTAHTDWNGTLDNGSGRVELRSSTLGTFDVSWPKRIADEADGTTSPEELLAAAHSSCYAMQFSALVAKAGGEPRNVQVTADASFGPDPSGGFRITGIKLTVRANAAGLDEGEFLKVAEAAKETCPVSKALTGVDIVLDAALV